ncbi:MAG: hypothetical protein HY738_12305 [Bacteroidia bacterium]|nr:hypothetical protein [Bacteroidia bacterium]
MISEQVKRLIPIEVKAGKTFSYDFFKNIRYWNELSGNLAENSYVVFGGDNDIDTSDGKAISWKNLTVLLNKL